jgi:hypothetical protein
MTCLVILYFSVDYTFNSFEDWNRKDRENSAIYCNVPLATGNKQVSVDDTPLQFFTQQNLVHRDIER